MKKNATLMSLFVLLAACGDDQQVQVPADTPQANTEGSVVPATKAIKTAVANGKGALVAEAKAAVMALGGALKGELQAAIKDGGPVAALEVCHIRAPELTRAVSAETSMDVKRVSLKNRNPLMGVPNAWQAAVLHDFEARKDEGEDPSTLAYSEVVDNEFRFMKAIPTEAVCLNCHGADIKPEVAAKLTELYPEDKATGFKEGDLRGAFVVIKTVSN